jgi:tripartite-type tricarboxylate transporter receptor subunit TctC
MKRVGRLLAGLLAAVVASSFLTIPAVAGFPEKPITLVIGFAPGGPSDVMARILTKRREEILKQPVVVENRAGAGGGIAATAVARAAPDGYTILLATGSSLAINVSLYKNLGYDPEKDFEPISLIGTQTNLLYVHPGSVPAKTLAEFIAFVKANPNKLTFGSGGIGTPAHLAGELLKVEAGLEMAHAPFRGTGQALQSVIGGHVPVAFNPPSPLLPHLQSGALTAIAVTTLKRTSALPEVPTIAESGYPGFDAATWHAVVAPPNLPKDVAATLHRAVRDTLNDPATKKALTDLGVDLVNSSPEQLRDYIKSEIPKWAKVVKASGATAGQ